MYYFYFGSYFYVKLRNYHEKSFYFVKSCSTYFSPGIRPDTMNINDDDGVDSDDYVDVIMDYSYSHCGRNNRIYRNERYMVLRRSENWWQVG